MEIVSNKNTLEVDLISNTIVDTTNKLRVFASDQIVYDTYEAQMNYFLECLKTKTPTFNTIANAVDTLKYALG